MSKVRARKLSERNTQVYLYHGISEATAISVRRLLCFLNRLRLAKREGRTYSITNASRSIETPSIVNSEVQENVHEVPKEDINHSGLQCILRKIN